MRSVSAAMVMTTMGLEGHEARPLVLHQAGAGEVVMRVKRSLLDVVLFLLLVLLCCDRWTGNAVHETAGVLAACAAALHLAWNRSWFAGFGRGRWPASRILRAAGILLVFGLFAAAAGTGAAMSRTIFAFSGTGESLDLRAWHMGLSHWLLLAAGVHLGLYWPRLAGALSWGVTSLKVRVPASAGLALLMLAGVRGLLGRDMGSVLAMQSAFSFWVENDAFWRVALEYAGMFALAAASAAWLSRRGMRACPDTVSDRAVSGRLSERAADGSVGREATRRV